ncbi:MAG TPA: SDR family NAD(P)-dependent oxidoreductase [Candidatus Baltobacteraceae bacterium]|jgi:NAD(P)-dependent dehydrogenase (short-subunit alcohol dehydrogenase family)
MNVTQAIVVTGASTGIGAAAALELAQMGNVIFAGVRNDADGARLLRAHSNLRPVRLDVTEPTSIAAAAQIVRAAGFRLVGLINNAGIVVAGPLEHVSEAELRSQFDVNVLGQIAVTQAFLPQLRESRGRIIFVGSVSGRISMPYIAPYSASKFALRALVDGLRFELAPDGILVALIEPGSVKTPIWRKGREQYEGRWDTLPARYVLAMQAVRAQSEREERMGIPTGRVTRAIVDALFARKPRTHYLIGASARLGGTIVPLLPARFRDMIFRKAMRLGGRK